LRTELYLVFISKAGMLWVGYRIQEHEVLVKRAADERAKNPNFHAVSEHDGLTWQRSQQQVAPFLCTFKPCPFLQEQF
jgi:hypothetical protein